MSSLLLVGACAHEQRRADPAALQATAEKFHELVRWKDFRGASELVVPERRAAFLKASHDAERDLSVTDYEVQSPKWGDDKHKASVVSRLRWVMLPSPTENDAEVTSDWVDYRGTWLLARQQAGPFATPLGEPYAGPPPEDAGS